MSELNQQGDDSQNRLKQISNIQSRLRRCWLAWLVFRGLILPILLGVLLTTRPDIVGGMAWQIMWLIPALILTPWMLKGKSPYALLMSSMVTLVYLGASAVTMFSRFYDSGNTVLWAYGIDVVLILIINILLFKLLKKLPSMNG